MTRFMQTRLLPLMAIATFVLAGLNSTGFAGNPRGEPVSESTPTFQDFPPLAHPSSAPRHGACGEGAPLIQGKRAWDRGYDDAMSGMHFATALMSRSGIIKAPLKGCQGYRDQHLSAQDIQCCMDGFNRGYLDLQRHILGMVHGGARSGRSAQCYASYSEGRTAADNKCRGLTERARRGESVGNSCELPTLGDDPMFLGCTSIGYLAGLNACPALASTRAAVHQALENGAMCNAHENHPEETPTAPAHPNRLPSAGSAGQSQNPPIEDGEII